MSISVPAPLAAADCRHFSKVPSGVMTAVVAIPVCNERDRVVGCLEALLAQASIAPASLGILLFLNNCVDGTRQVIEDWLPLSPWPVRIIEQDSPSASAGWARRQAMEAGAAWLGDVPAGILLTTDADSRVPPDWVARNIQAIEAGADAVAGRTMFDPVEMATLPAGFRQRQDRELEYDMLLAEVEAVLDPRPGDPWPRHRMKSGASIAVSVPAYRAVGGMPSISSGEDHAFIDLFRAHNLVVRHAPDIVVTTSSRLEGRARDGTADALKRRCGNLDSPCDARLERLMAFVWRVLRRRFFGSAVAGMGERYDAQRALRPRDLPREIGRARHLVKMIRWLQARRDDTRSSGQGFSNGPKRLSTP